jgi:8-oxo-dGTP pyrophosphatase MutT (NUDIX family)/phosphohistidine phosphatase SixA
MHDPLAEPAPGPLSGPRAGPEAGVRARGTAIMAAGAVAWRPGDDGQPRILLVHRPKYGDWSLPKGKAEPGEPAPLTAVREVLEESGARLALGRRLAPARYQAGGRPKTVRYWSARVTGTDPGAVPNGEVDQIAWLALERARERVSYPRDAAVLADFAAAPAATEPVILLRHAQALPRAAWRGQDAGRPLDEQGRAEAAGLAALLACFAPRAQVLSSAAVRCLDTVGPYALLTGAPVRPSPALLPSSRTSPAVPLAQLIAAPGAAGPAVICAHRENLPALMAAAAAALGAPALPAACADPLPPGGFVVLHAAAGALVAADRYHPPGS